MKRQTASSDIISCLAFLQWITMRSMTQFTRSLYTSFINYQLAGVCQAVGFNHRGEHHGSGLQNEKRRSMTEFSNMDDRAAPTFPPCINEKSWPLTLNGFTLPERERDVALLAPGPLRDRLWDQKINWEKKCRKAISLQTVLLLPAWSLIILQVQSSRYLISPPLSHRLS